MEYKNIEYSSIIQTVSAAIAIFTAIGGIIWSIIKRLARHKLNITSYYISQSAFSDRNQSLTDMIKMIQTRTKVINVYGKRGIGKSAFLRFLCDCINCNLSRENRNRKEYTKSIKKLRAKAFYFHLSGDGSHSINDQIISQVSGLGLTLTEIAENLAHLIRRKRILIVLDNINNAGLGKEIESVIDTFLAYSDRYHIIVGSIEKQAFLNIMNERQLGYIELPTFDQRDIFDFAERNSKKLQPETLAQIIDFSDGLPIFINLLLNSSSSYLSTITYDKNRMDTYLGRIIDELDESLCVLAQYIAFLSITKPTISVEVFEEFNITLPSMCFETLENFSLIEFNRKSKTICMHELFRDYICFRFSRSTEIIRKIYKHYYHAGMQYEQIYYLIMLKSDDSNGTIVRGIQKAISEENFSFLLMIGEHYKRLYNWNAVSGHISERTFLAIVLGYVEGLIGVGNYLAAREVIDRCKIAARSPKTDLQFRFSLLTAKLYHLQNDYDESISLYSILLSGIYSNKEFEKYESRCLWGIAHAYRHQGRDFNAAIAFYDKSISSAKKLGRKSEVLRGMREKLTVLLCQEQMKSAKKLYRKISFYMTLLPEEGYKETKASYQKVKAQYISVSEKRNNSNSECNLLLNVLYNYRMQRKRLQYNVYFQLGEYYRHLEKYASAKENYEKAHIFSKKNQDRNLETMSLIALGICNICTNSSDISDTESEIVKCIDTCEQHNLYMNKLLSEMLLAYLQKTHVDKSVLTGFMQLRYTSAVNACRKMDYKSLLNLYLFMM